MLDKKAYLKKWKKEHPEKVKANREKYYKLHRKQIKAHRKKYYEDHKEQSIDYCKKYCKSHREQHRKNSIKWRLSHPEKVRISFIKYRLAYPEKVRERRKKHIAKRRRSLGFIPLNKYFLGADGHHINYNYVIYIPKTLHRSVWHSLSSGVGMEKINRKAFEFLKEKSVFKGETYLRS